MRSLLFIIYTVSSFYSIFGQGGNQPGFVILANGDTLQGEIKLRDELKNYESCVFVNESGEKTYSSEDILGYGFRIGAFFSSQIIQSEFVEVIIEGKLNLYIQKDVFYIKKEGEELTKLDYRVVKTEDGKSFYKDLKWKRLLAFYTSDCSGAKLSPDKLTYNRNSISKFVINYNTCATGEYKSYVSKGEKELFLIGGFNLQSVSFDNLQSSVSLYPPGSIDTNPISIGVGLTMAIKKIKGLNLNFGFLYQHSEKEDHVTIVRTQSFSETTYDYKYKFTFSQLEAPLYVSYPVKNHNLEIRLLYGLNPAFLSKSTGAPWKGTRTIESFINPTTSVNHISGDLLIDHTNKQLYQMYFSQFVGASIHHHKVLPKFGLDFRYFMPAELKSNVDESLDHPKLERMAILLKYNL